MSTGLIIAIVVVVLIVLVVLLLLPRLRREAAEKKRQREIEQRRHEAADQHRVQAEAQRTEAQQRQSHADAARAEADAAEQRVAAQRAEAEVEAKRADAARAEAEAREARADLTEQGHADHEIGLGDRDAPGTYAEGRAERTGAHDRDGDGRDDRVERLDPRGDDRVAGDRLEGDRVGEGRFDGDRLDDGRRPLEDRRAGGSVADAGQGLGRSHEPDGSTRERTLRATPPEQREGVLDEGGVRPKPRRDV